MRKNLVFPYIILFILLSFSVAFAGDLKWYDYDKGAKLAKTENKIILVDFYTDWCGWCKKMDATTYKNDKVVDYLNKYFVAVKLNPEKKSSLSYKGQNTNSGQLARDAGVNGFPATGFFTSNEEFLGVISGYIAPEDFIDLLSKVVESTKSKK